MSLRHCVLILSLLLLPLPLSLGATETRQWQDSSGKFTVEAELVEEKPDVVVLRKTNGVVIEVPVAKLSRADRRYLEELNAPPEAENPFEGAPVMTPEHVDESTDLSVNGFWESYREFMEHLDGQGEQGKRVIRRLQTLSDLSPEFLKHPILPILCFVTALLLTPLAYIWILKHEFQANPLWGIAQILADIMGACLVPFFGALVTLLFAMGHLRDSWRPVLFYLLVSILFLGSFALVSGDMYDELGLLEQETEIQYEEEEPEEDTYRRSYRPGKFRYAPPE